MTFTAPIGLQFAQRRVSLGMSQAELARLCGMSESGIYRIENGSRAPLLSTAAKICRFLDVGLVIDEHGTVRLDDADPPG